MFVVKTDGSFVGPPVSVGIGAFVVLQNGRRIHEEAARDERVTSSTVAEALAIVKALLWLESKGYHKDAVVVATDSRSTLDVVRGKVAKTRSKMLDEFCDWIKAASRNFADLVFLNCHRAEVSEAQQLARIALRPERRAIKEGTEVIPEPPALPPTPAIHVPTTAAAVEAEPRKGRRRGRRGGRGRRKTPAAAAPVAAAPVAPKPVKPVAAPPPPPPKPAPKAGRPEPVKTPALNFLQQAILRRKK